MADYAISGARLQPIYERLNSAPRYHPIEAETFADWSMEAGDIVTITRDGQSYESPVQTSVVRWRKGQQVSVSSGGNQQRDAVSKVSQNKYSRASGGAGLRNSRHLGGSIEASYNELAAGLVVTASGIYTYAINQYTGLSSGLTQTASALTAFVNSRYDEMTAGLEITSSSFHAYVEDRYRDMRSGLDITSSSFHAYVEDRYKDMRSGLRLTASSAALYAGSAENAAQIVARINAAGQSEIELLASHIYMGAGGQPVSVVVNGKISASYITADLIAGKIADIEDVSVKKIHSERGSAIFHTVSAKHYLNVSDVDCSYLPNGVRTLQIVQSGDGYKLQKTTYANPDTWTDVGTFSRATSLTGAWSGNKCTVTASPQGATWSVGFTNDADSMISIDTNGAATATNLRKTISVPLRVVETKGTTQTNVYTKDQTVNAEIAWNNGWDDAREKIAMPASGGTAETFTVKVPNTARNGQTNRLFKIQKGDTPGPTGYASVILFPEGSDGSGNGNLVGRIDIGDWYTAGKAAGSGGGAATVSNVSTQNDQWSPTGTQAGYVGYSSLVRNGYISFRVAVSGGSTTTWYIKINP